MEGISIGRIYHGVFTYLSHFTDDVYLVRSLGIVQDLQGS